MSKRIIVGAVLLLAACSQSEDGGNNSAEGATGGQVIESVPSNLQDDPNNSVVPLGPPPAVTPGPDASPIAALPAAFQGRWGMVANDCIPGRADAKGLMVVGPESLRFYESRARIQQAAALRPTAIRLQLAFTGEGQEWTRTSLLTLEDGGRTLIRDEQPEGTFRYTRCPAG